MGNGSNRLLLSEQLRHSLRELVEFDVGRIRLPVAEIGPVQSLKARGASTCSRNTGTRIPRRLPSDASFRTHSEATEIPDHSTITHLASLSAFSMTSSKDFPKGIFRSHQTDQP